MNKITNSISIAVGQGFSFISNFLSFIIIAHILSIPDFAVFTVLLSVLAVTSKMTEVSSLTMALKNFIGNHTSEINPNDQLAVRYLGAILGFLFAFLYVLFAYCDFNISVSVILLGFIILLSSRIDSVRNFYEQPFKAVGKMHHPVISSLIENAILLIGLSSLFYVQFENNLLMVCLVYGISGSLGFLYIKIRQNQFYPGLKFNFPDFRVLLRIVRQSFPVAVWGVMNIVYQQMDIFFLKNFASDSEIAGYAVAMRLTIPLLFIIVPIHTIFYPRILRELSQTNESSPLISAIFKIYIIVPLIIFISVWVHAEYITTTIFGDQYSLAAAPFIILLGNQVFVFLIFLGSDLLISENKQLKISLIVSGMIIIDAGIVIFFHQMSALWVVSLAKVISSGIGVCFIGYYLSQSNIKPNLLLFKIFGLASIPIIFQIAFGSFLPPLFEISSVFIIFILLIWVSGVFTKQQIIHIKEILLS